MPDSGFEGLAMVVCDFLEGINDELCEVIFDVDFELRQIESIKDPDVKRDRQDAWANGLYCYLVRDSSLLNIDKGKLDSFTNIEVIREWIERYVKAFNLQSRRDVYIRKRRAARECTRIGLLMDNPGGECDGSCDCQDSE